MDLSNDELLNKCTHGETQNANEALDKVIWTKCPKTTFVELSTLEMGVHSAVIQYNDGLSAVKDLLDQFSIPFGTVTRKISNVDDQISIKNSNRKSSEVGKKQRKSCRRKNKYKLDNENGAEPEE